ncbi:MAG: YoaK family protein [Solirubrobacteraceae bacterium]
MSALPRGLRARWPWSAEHGTLPGLLIALTLLTALVDAVRYLALGYVFVANMTGNVVFLGLAVAGARGLSAVASLIALGAFVLGAMGGGRSRRVPLGTVVGTCAPQPSSRSRCSRWRW